MVDPIFQDPELQAKFESQGYVKIPFLTQEEVTYLVELFWKLHPNHLISFVKKLYLHHSH